MKFMLLVYLNEQEWDKLSQAEKEKMMEHGNSFANELKEKNQFLAGAPLEPVAAARTIRRRAGGLLVTDGPFAETREQLGGYALIEAKDLAEAIEIGKRFHSGGLGAIEVRPVLEGGCG